MLPFLYISRTLPVIFNYDFSALSSPKEYTVALQLSSLVPELNSPKFLRESIISLLSMSSFYSFRSMRKCFKRVVHGLLASDSP